jgi:hypothetical protein
LVTVTLTAGKRATLDATLAEAVDVARAALEELAPDGVGEHLGAEPESERVVVHYFASDLPGYLGWRWAVTVMRASRSKTATVGETVLLPGPDALLPPAWVPWTERLRPGDLRVGDLLPTDEDDERLEPGWNSTEVASGITDGVIEPVDRNDADDSAIDGAIDVDDDGEGDDDRDRDRDRDFETLPRESGLAFDVALELDLLRPRVLSPIGLDDAVDRWVAGDHGPEAPMAQAFGICANEISPSDGHVVTMDHGCGAHSEAVVVPTMAERTEPAIDDGSYEVVARETPDDAMDIVDEPADALTATAQDEPSEPAVPESEADVSASEPASG